MRPREDARREPCPIEWTRQNVGEAGRAGCCRFLVPGRGGTKAMSHSENASKLAIACCIHQCSESPAPLTCLQDYLDGLRELGWDDDALSAIKRDVLAALTDAGRHELTPSE